MTHYVKPLGGSWPYRLYIDNTSDGPELKAEADCQSGMSVGEKDNSNLLGRMLCLSHGEKQRSM